MVDIAGYFINLDRSLERRHAIEAEIAKAGLRDYQRFPALDGSAFDKAHFGVTPSEAGCFLSHLSVLEKARTTGRHIHVLEDDAVLCRLFAAHRDATVDGGLLEQFDIVFTDMLVPFNEEFLRNLLKRFDDYRVNKAFSIIGDKYWAGMVSYLVNRKSIDKLVHLLRQHVESGMASSIDICLRDLAASGQIKVGCLFPFVSSLSISQVLGGTISRPAHWAPQTLMLALQRAAFYIEADLKSLKRTFDEISLNSTMDRTLHAFVGKWLDALETAKSTSASE